MAVFIITFLGPVIILMFTYGSMDYHIYIHRNPVSEYVENDSPTANNISGSAHQQPQTVATTEGASPLPSPRGQTLQQQQQVTVAGNPHLRFGVRANRIKVSRSCD